MGHKVYLPADTTKHLRPAGLGSSYADTARKCMTWETERPTTPDKIKPYRQSTVHEPGVILRHYGAARDPVDFEATNGVVRIACAHVRTPGGAAPACSTPSCMINVGTSCL